MKAILLTALLLGLGASVAWGAEPTWNKKTAAARLDERAKWWLDSGISQRATDAKGQDRLPEVVTRPCLTHSRPSHAR